MSEEKKYKLQIPISWTVATDVEIVASSIEEATRIASNMPLPDGEYVDGSFEIDNDTLEFQNEGIIEVMKIDGIEFINLPLLINELKTPEGKKRYEERLREGK